MPAHPALEQLAAILRDSESMLALATNAEWDQLAALELARRSGIAALRSAEANNALLPATEPERSLAIDMMRRIVAIDAETRTLAEQWMTRLASDLAALQTAKKIGDAYSGR